MGWRINRHFPTFLFNTTVNKIDGHYLLYIWTTDWLSVASRDLCKIMTYGHWMKGIRLITMSLDFTKSGKKNSRSAAGEWGSCSTNYSDCWSGEGSAEVLKMNDNWKHVIILWYVPLLPTRKRKRGKDGRVGRYMALVQDIPSSISGSHILVLTSFVSV